MLKQLKSIWEYNETKAMRHLPIILFMLISALGTVMPGCRCQKERSKATASSTTGMIDVRSRRVDSLLDSHAAAQTIRIEYFSPSEISLGQVLGADTFPVSHCGTQAVREGNWPVKSVEIKTEVTCASTAVAVADTSATVAAQHEEATLQEEASDTRNDNGTWIGIAVVASVAFLLYQVLKGVLK